MKTKRAQSLRKKSRSAKPGLTKKHWTKEEVATLKRLHRTHSNADIAKVVKRLVTSVAFKAHRLGIRKGVRRMRKMGQENIQHRWGT